jgi:hypothetical protein
MGRDYIARQNDSKAPQVKVRRLTDVLLHDTLISKNVLHGVVGPLVGVYADLATMVMASTRPA